MAKKKAKITSNANYKIALEESYKLDRPSDFLMEIFVAQVNGIASKPNFSGYSFRDEMISHALETLFKRWRSFDAKQHIGKTNFLGRPSQFNPFAYYYTAIIRAFTQVINIEHKHLKIRDALLVDAGKLPSYYTQEEDGGDIEEVRAGLDIPEIDEEEYIEMSDEIVVDPDKTQDIISYDDDLPK